MKKVLLIGLLGVVLLIFITYFLLSHKLTSIPVSTSTNNGSTWLKDLIKQEENGSIANPPASLTKCVYKNQNVYYLPQRCCDIPSVLYNDKGEAICSPDGGLIGKGGGKCTDFFEIRKDCVVVWKDTRSQ